MELSPEITKYYTAMRTLSDGRICGVHRLLYHWTMHIDISEWGYEDRYCFATEAMAIEAMEAWDGNGDPVNWHRHPASGRRRDTVTGEITFNP
jgi:hypothetical protein